MIYRRHTFLGLALVAGGLALAALARAQMPGETDNGYAPSYAPPPGSPDPGQNTSYQPPGADTSGEVGQAGAPAANETPAVNFQTFYDSLSNEGTWIQTPQFGYVWQPNVNDPQWAPYTNGHWVYSDAGWTWVSSEPWGWATYHYGRWVNLDGTGWCWVPGYTWAPAWVSWRYGDGYVGWAPLPPDSLVGVDYDADQDDGFHIGGDCDSYYGIGAGWYCFLPILYIGERDYRHFYVDRYHNYRLINRTTNVTNLNVGRGGARGGNVFAGASLGGPSLREVNAASQTPVAQVNLAFSNRVGGGAVNGNSLDLFAPRVRTAAGGHAPGSFHSVSSAVVNRGTDASRPMMVTSHVPGTSFTADQIQQARSAQANAPVSARVATPGAVAPSFQSQPLTSMRPAGAPASADASYPRGYSAPGYPAQGYSQRGYSSSPGETYSRPSSIYNNSTPRNYSSGGGSPNYNGGAHSTGGNPGYPGYGGSGGGGGGGGGYSHGSVGIPQSPPGH